MKLIEKVKFTDKVIFTFNLTLLVVFFLLLGCSPTYYFFYFYSVFLIFLICYRIVTWIKDNSFLYLLEFCYFGNVIQLVFLFFAPKNERVFFMMFGSNTGVISLAAVFLKNRIAFSRMDQFLSVALHTMPSVICFLVRW